MPNLCRLLAGGTPEDLAGIDADEAKLLVNAARAEGVSPLLYQHLGLRLPEPWAHTLRQDALRSEAVELLRQANDWQLLDALAATGIDALLMKGAVLGCSVYGSPGQRPRTDTDLLIRETDVDGSLAVLGRLGYEVAAGDTGSTLHYQLFASRKLPNGQAHGVDVHWRINNRLEFARLFDFDELRSRALPLSPFGPAALGLGLSDSLLLACLHRVGHLNEGEPERLIWLYDIHLLVEHLDGAVEQEFITLMREKRLTGICDAGVSTAARCFGTRLSPQFADELKMNTADEPTRGLLGAGPLGTLWRQFLAQPGWNHRWRFLRELTLPPEDYMRRKYPASVAPVAWLWLRRGLEGVQRRVGKG